MQAIADAGKGLQILVNNAGINLREPVADMDESVWQRMLDTNLTSVFRVSRAAFPMLKERGGRVLNRCSLMSEIARSIGSLSTSRAEVAEIMEPVECVDGKPYAVDMVASIGLLKEGRFELYTQDITTVVNALEGRDIIVKAILETSLLDPGSHPRGLPVCGRTRYKLCQNASEQGRRSSPVAYPLSTEQRVPSGVFLWPPTVLEAPSVLLPH